MENCGSNKKPMLCGASPAGDPEIVCVAVGMIGYVTQAQLRVDSGHRLSFLCNATWAA
jgi:hypothetical protein